MTAAPDMAVDLAIVGAGPAAMAAAGLASGHGLSVMVIDEQPRPGGQFLHQPPAEFSVAGWLPGRLYAHAKTVLADAIAGEDIDWRLGQTVLGLFPRRDDSGHRLWLATPSSTTMVAARTVLLANGAYDLPVVFPGWTLPGVMATGGIQTFIKSQQLLPGARFVLAGSHPLQLIVADQIVRAGGTVAAVIFAQSAARAARLAAHPLIAMRHGAQLGAIAGIIARLTAAGVPIRFGQAVVEAEGGTALDAVHVAPLTRAGAIVPDAASTIPCDRLGLCYGFLASSELARQAGAACDWRAEQGGWIVHHDRWMRSTVPDLWVAGEITGVAGADVALEEGRLAALGILQKLGRLMPERAEKLARPVRRRLVRGRTFGALLQSLSAPPSGLLNSLMADDATLCRCECVSVGTLRQILADNPSAATANAMKLLTRAGMGPCQGRFCQHNVVRLVADARGIAEGDTGGFTAQAPIKPVPVGLAASLDPACGRLNQPPPNPR